MRLTTKGKTGAGAVTIEGDAEFFAWLSTAANSASNGFTGNKYIDPATGADRLVLAPTDPRPLPDQNPRSRTAHQVAHDGAGTSGS